MPSCRSAPRVRGGAAATLFSLAALLGTSGPAQSQERTLAELRAPTPRALQMSAFELPAEAIVSIDAVGAPAGVFRELSRGLFSKLLRGFAPRVEWDESAWAANAWILDARTRRLVWELSRSSGRRLHNELRAHAGRLRLPAGAYEVYYATTAPGVSRNGRPEWQVDRAVVEKLGITVRGAGRPLPGPALQRVRAPELAEVVVAIDGSPDGATVRRGFEVTRPTTVEILMVGEARRSQAFDHGWLINADTRQKVWTFKYANSRSAGGAAKNRLVHERVTLPPGRYAATYVSDRSHGPGQWNTAPPYDPYAWGLYIRVPDAAARAGVRHFEYELVPQALTVASLTQVGNREARRAGFSLTRPADVRLYALGEGTARTMEDYAWVVNAASRQVVWEMVHDNTEPAGGAAKNRVFDGVVRLPAGDYEVHYVSDATHAYGQFNAGAPPDPEYWGVSVLAARAGDRDAFREYDPAQDPRIVAQLVGIGNQQRARRSFTLTEPEAVHVYALGEGMDNELYDYAWLEEAETGRRVWEMTYAGTRAAGGAAKNRLFEGTLQLPAGEYLLHYRSDDSHAFGSWNERPPRDASMWGVTLRRAEH